MHNPRPSTTHRTKSVFDASLRMLYFVILRLLDLTDFFCAPDTFVFFDGLAALFDFFFASIDFVFDDLTTLFGFFVVPDCFSVRF